ARNDPLTPTPLPRVQQYRSAQHLRVIVSSCTLGFALSGFVLDAAHATLPSSRIDRRGSPGLRLSRSLPGPVRPPPPLRHRPRPRRETRTLLRPVRRPAAALLLQPRPHQPAWRAASDHAPEGPTALGRTPHRLGQPQ